MRRLLAGLALAWFAAVVLRTAWLADDAFITLRTIDNWQHGFGLRWNPVERVQTYTHPLWMLLTAAVQLLPGDGFTALMLQATAISVAAVGLLGLRLASTTTGAVLAIAALCGSNAFVDYSTSGLENPLTHLLLGLFLLVALSPREAGPARVLRLALLAALLAVNRMDTLLLCLPALAVEAWHARSAATVRALGIGLLPLLAWELFSLLYYGFPLPNTAYAKLGSGIESGELAVRGLVYLGQSLRADPLTLTVTAAGLATIFVRRAHLPLAAGAVLYLAYVVSVGGDFMAGRFLTAPLFVGVALLARVPFQFPARSSLATGAALVALTLAAERGSWARPDESAEPPPIPPHGITDERFQYPGNSLLTLGFGGAVNLEHADAGAGLRAGRAGAEVIALHAVGMAGLLAGPEVFVLDRAGLCDPLLARLPAKYDPGWRTGHFWRALPAGYPESLPAGALDLEDRDLVELAAALRLAARAPLFDPARLRAIWDLNTGALSGAVDRDLYRHPLLTRVALEHGSDAWSWRASPELELPAAVVELSAAQPWHRERLLLETEQARIVRVVGYLEDRRVMDLGPAELGQRQVPNQGRRSYSVPVPPRVARQGLDRIRVFPAQRRDPGRLRPAWLRLAASVDAP